MRAAGVLGILAFAICAEAPLLFVLSYSGGAGDHPLRMFFILVAWALVPIGAAAAIPVNALLRNRSIQFDHTPYTIIAIAGTACGVAATQGGHGSEAALLLGFVAQCASAVWALIAGRNLTRRSKADAR
jgi:hypothetical protein